MNLHYRPETITALLGDGARLGVRVRYSWEQPILGSAGGPRRAFALTAADRLWLVNGDTICDVPLDAMAAAHASSDALVTMAVIPNPDTNRYGGATLDGDVVTGFVPRGHGPSWHFIGVQIAEREAFEALQDGVADGKRRPQLPRAHCRAARQRPGVSIAGGVSRHRHASRLPGGVPAFRRRRPVAPGGRRARAWLPRRTSRTASYGTTSTLPVARVWYDRL